MRIKMSKQPPPAPTASAVGPCPTVILIVGPTQCVTCNVNFNAEYEIDTQ